MDAPSDTRPTPLAEMAARSFPLVARSQVISRPLPTRISQIETRAEHARQGGPDGLLRAAEALNLAALLASDCGDADLARTLCWQQFDVFHAARPHPAGTAKLALQPLINLARLHTRAGDGTTAFTLLHDLFTGITTGTTLDVDGRTTDLSALTHPTDQRQLCAWLWEILLIDGMRALARAGRWEQARSHAEQLHGIGRHLGDGRQIAVLAHIFNGRPADAHDLLGASDLADSWEETVAACLTVLSRRTHGQPTGDATTHQMINGYLGLRHDLTLVTVQARLGLTVIDLLDNDPGDHTAEILQRLADLATAPGGGYAARDLLQHPCSSQLTGPQRDELRNTAQAAGLSLGSLPGQFFTRLLDAVETGTAAIAAEIIKPNVTQGTAAEDSRAG